MGYETEGRELYDKEHGVIIEPAPGATKEQTIVAFATDLLRRAQARELSEVTIVAEDKLTGALIQYQV